MDILALADTAAPWIWGGTLIFVRLSAMLALLPDFGSGRLPMQLRLVLALALTVAIDAALGLVWITPPASPAAILVMVAREVVLGAALGMAFRLVIAAATAAGDLVGINMALSLNTLFDISSGEQQIATGRLFAVVGTLFFFALGGHLLITATLFEHIARHPVGAAAFYLPSLEVLVDAGIHFFRSALILAAPVIVVTLILNTALGFLMRVVPSVNIFNIGLSVLMFGGFVALQFEGDALMIYFARELDALPEAAFIFSGVPPAGP